MDSFEKVLPKILKLQLFSEFDSSNPTDVEILKSVYDILEIKGDECHQDGNDNERAERLHQ